MMWDGKSNANKADMGSMGEMKCRCPHS